MTKEFDISSIRKGIEALNRARESTMKLENFRRLSSRVVLAGSEFTYFTVSHQSLIWISELIIAAFSSNGK